MNIQSLFEPASIAVVGASTETGSVGNDIVKNLVEQKFKGTVFPVNPKATELYGIRCYPNLAAIEGEVECVIVVVPAKIVPQILREAVGKKVKAAIVISAGFGEVGNVALEQDIADIARSGDMALLGPNCLGVVNPALSMNASFARTLPKKGNVAFLSQSGALGTAVLDMMGQYGVGVSKFASLGNKATIDESALLDYLARDRKTKVIAIYAEDLRNPEAIRKAAHRMAHAKHPKPIIVLKSGRTSAGASALSSHTGSLAGNDASYRALFAEAGILRAETSEELFLLARAFSLAPLPEGRNVAILTNAGGPGVLSADAAIGAGLTLSRLLDATSAELQTFLPSAASVKNPIDILGDAKSDRYSRSLDLVLADPSVHMALIVLTPQSMTDVEVIAEKVSESIQKFAKPAVVVFMGGKLVAGGVKILLKKKIPVANFPEDGIRMLSALADFAESRVEMVETKYSFTTLSRPENIDVERARNIFQTAKDSGRATLSPLETLDVFTAYGFPVPRYRKATSADEAIQAAREISAPLAMKILSDDITHKTDVGGVLLGVSSERVEEAFQTIQERVRQSVPEARIDGVLLMEMAIPGGVELILGSFRDPKLGATVMLGSGGIYSEILKDTAFGLAPVSRNRAEYMLSTLRIFPILHGARGGAPFDTVSVIECVGRLSQLLADFPDIRELDVNPLIVYPEAPDRKGVLLVDGRILLTL